MSYDNRVLDSRLRGNDAPVVMPAPAYARTGSGGHPVYCAWLKAHWQEYPDHWVALRDGQLVYASPSFPGTLLRYAKAIGMRPAQASHGVTAWTIFAADPAGVPQIIDEVE